MSESYYVLEKFAEHRRTLAGLRESMPIKRRAIDIYKQKNKMQSARETYAELEGLKKRLLEAVCGLRLLFCECDVPDSADFCRQLYGAVKNFNLLTPDYTKLMEALERLTDFIPQTEAASGKTIGHLMNNVKMGYFPTDLEHVGRIQSALAFPDCRVNLLDPCCGCGLALERLGLQKDVATYGIEIDETRGKEAESRLDRVGFGSFYHSRISHEAFHALFLNPPYLSVMNEGGSKARSEKRFLVESMHHLMQAGILIYIIPYYRLTWDICRVICDNFRNVSVYRFMDEEFAKFKQVVVFGIKKKKEDGSQQAEVLSQYAMLPEKIPMIDMLQPESYPLPDNEKAVELFKGAVFNLGELQRQMAKSKSCEMFFEKSKIDAMEKQPLLPLNLGQVGLIGGSGLINGYVDCDSPHVIKGRVVKEVKKRENIEDGTLTETRVNKMLFHLLTPDGMKRLA